MLQGIKDNLLVENLEPMRTPIVVKQLTVKNVFLSQIFALYRRIIST
jgi:hypothetical protein